MILFIAFAISINLCQAQEYDLGKPSQRVLEGSDSKMDLLSFEQLGFTLTTKQLDANRTRIEIKDKLTEETLIITQNVLDMSEEKKLIDKNRKLLFHSLRKDNEIQEADYTHTLPTKKVRSFNATGGYTLRIFKKQGTSWVWFKEKNVGISATMQCNASLEDAELLRRINNLRRPLISFSHGDQNRSGYHPIQPNSRSKNCQDYPSQGESSMIRDLEGGFNQGLRCMNSLYEQYKNHADARVRAKAAGFRTLMKKLMGNFVPGARLPFTFKCENDVGSWANYFTGEITKKDVYAFAKTCGENGGEKDVPGIVLNTTAFRTLSRHDRKSTLFHELFHHAGYYHDEDSNTYDVVYGLQSCCFGASDAPRSITQIDPSDFSCRRLMSQNHGQSEDGVPNIQD